MDTLAILEQKYQEYNAAYFNGRLPTIPIRWGKLKHATALVDFQVIGIKGGKKRYHGGLNMVFSDKYSRPAETLFPVLLHEMIHVYIVHILDDIEDNHGHVFLKLRRQLSEWSGIDIPLTDNATADLELKIPIKPVCVVLTFSYDDTARYALISKSTITSNLANFPEIFKRDKVEVREVESEIWTRKASSMRIQRNLSHRTAYFRASEQDMADLYEHSRLVWTNRVLKEGEV